MTQHQVEDILEKVLNTLFQVVAVYACDRLKVQKKYYEAYWWFERRNKIIEEEIRIFIRTRGLGISGVDGNECARLQDSLDINEDDVVYKITQYYWDSYQYHNTDYIGDFLDNIKLTEKDLILFLNQVTRRVRKRERWSFVEITEFSERYVFSTFVGKERLINTLFKYFQIIYELKYEGISLSGDDLQEKILDLIKIIPYYSITSRSSIASTNIYQTEMGERQYAKLLVPFDFREGALVDSIVHFIFQHLCDLFKFDKIQDQPSIFNLWRHHKAEYLSQIEANSELSSEFSRDYDYSIDKNEHYIRLNECVNIIKKLLAALPIEQSRIFESCKNTATMEPLLLSIIYANFIQQYDLEEANKNPECDLKEVYSQPLKHKSVKLKAFFKYLEKEFNKLGFQTELLIHNNADECVLIIKGESIIEGTAKILVSLSRKPINGNNVRSRFGNHENFFTFE